MQRRHGYCPMLESGIMVNELGNRGVIVRGLVLLVLLAVSSLPAIAMRHLTVAQLEKTLSSEAARHRSDGDMMR